MTRADYQLLARVLTDPSLHLPASKLRAIVSRLADELQGRREFNRARFFASFNLEDYSA